jgi:hypothetical protein
MYSPAIAEQLRDRGHDVEAVLERDDLVGLPDLQLFAAVQTDERSLVTENVSDFMPLHSTYATAAQPHHGLIFTTNSKFPRGAPGTIGALVAALDAMLTEPPTLEPSDGWVHWL